MALKEFKKILVPTDYSEMSLAALDYALTFSQMFGAQIYLFHTLDTIPVLSLESMDLTTESVIYETEQNAKSDLHDFRLSRIGEIPNLVELVRKGIAEDEIVKLAREENFDLIIMATHGRSGIAHVLMGSVAEKVVQRSPAPVLTVKPGFRNASASIVEGVAQYHEFERSQ
jgi:nucleotide-binding universal stress UspA family protein